MHARRYYLGMFIGTKGSRKYDHYLNKIFDTVGITNQYILTLHDVNFQVFSTANYARDPFENKGFRADEYHIFYY